jgi:hypothetical protein
VKISQLSRASLLLAVVLVAAPASAQVPTLIYDSPRGFMGGQGWKDPQLFVDSMVEGSVEVTGFRPFQGDFRATLPRTLFADRMSAEFSQPKLLSPPTTQPLQVPGADDALMIAFVAQQNFYTYFHRRVAILAKGAVAIVDARARSAERLQADWPAVSAMLQSMRVGPGAAASASSSGSRPSADNVQLAGLYMAPRQMFQGNAFGAPGSGTWVASTYWYLLSEDGRVQRGYRLPQAPNGDLARFDYDAARRDAPADSGSYKADSGRVTFVMGTETLVADRMPDGNLRINGTVFQKSIAGRR